MAIFSVVTWIDACPIGWQNRRMEFLGDVPLIVKQAQVWRLLAIRTVPAKTPPEQRSLP